MSDLQPAYDAVMLNTVTIINLLVKYQWTYTLRIISPSGENMRCY